MDDHLVDEAGEEGLLLLRPQAVLTPEHRDRLAGLEEGFSFLGTEPFRGSGWVLLLFLPQPLFGILEVSQRRFPAPFQLGGHQAVVRVGLVVLPLGQAGLVAEPIDRLSLGLLDLVGLPAEGGHGPVLQVQLRWRQGIEESLHDVRVNGISGQVLADGHAVLLAKIVADIMVPFLYCTTILCPHSPQETMPWSRALPGRGTPRLWLRSYAL